MVGKVLSIVVAVLFCWFAPGCTSERDQTMKNLQDMHQKVRTDDGKPARKWEMNPDSK